MMRLQSIAVGGAEGVGELLGGLGDVGAQGNASEFETPFSRNTLVKLPLIIRLGWAALGRFTVSATRDPR
jgi:hypothetical protein